MTRDELFAGLCFLGCINGLGVQIIQSSTRVGWAAALLETSAIVWCACCVGLLFLLREKREAMKVWDGFVRVLLDSDRAAGV